MKAIVMTRYGSPEVLQLKDVEKPEPGSDQILIRIHAASVNDWDWGLVRGRPFLTRMLSGLFRPGIKTPGTDMAGCIEAAGKDVAGFSVGDRVFGDLSESGFGAFSQYVCLKPDAVFPIPESMTYEEAAAIPHASMLACQGLLDIGKLKSKQKILINGAGGGVGTFGLQIAKMFDAHVTGVDTAEKHEMMLSLGFDHVIDYKKEDFTDSGQEYDLILDAKTNRPASRYARALRPGGNYVTVGGSLYRILGMMLKSPFYAGKSQKHLKLVALKPNKDLDYISRLYEQEKIKPVISHTFKLNETAEALKLFGEGKHKGKVVITI